jgi:hypothetical protein
MIDPIVIAIITRSRRCRRPSSLTGHLGVERGDARGVVRLNGRLRQRVVRPQLLDQLAMEWTIERRAYRGTILASAMFYGLPHGYT